MKPCWRDHGLTEEGAKLADLVIGDVVAVLGRCEPSIRNSVIKEARFRIEELQTKTYDYRKRYERENF